MSLILSLAQMSVVPGDPDTNRATADTMVQEAAARGSTLLLLPELWGTGYDLSNAAHHALASDPPLFAAMAGWAREHRMWVGGSLLGWAAAPEGQPRNLFALFDPHGNQAFAYAKLHRFRLMEEDQWLGAGDEAVLAELPWGATGMAICYDLRFPELFRHYALAGARLMLLPAQWPYPRLEHWQTLLRARAIENQCFVAACNRVGTDPNDSTFCGHSAVIDPWGNTLIEGNDRPALLTATVDLSLSDYARSRIPVFEDRRADVYG